MRDLLDYWTRMSVEMEGCPIPTEACQAIGCADGGGCSVDEAIRHVAQALAERVAPRVEWVVDEGTVRSLEREIARLTGLLADARAQAVEECLAIFDDYFCAGGGGRPDECRADIRALVPPTPKEATHAPEP